ncbi:hypothetical protein GCM10010245_30380 [Streptomyces spectabilis]|uniref:Uncharacterized protein n=1 Tax=Streptomyces spectabilis TaxID=68270 RepID=A0A5P2XCU3_STRST|nr:hypothetical protein [Streptomyces spectabilis]QEV61005.1 hypothetical protein CP982_21730 [Streptomyces spectabilis]GGV17972.1 hypothetical protein GCM10010245_30380 [Streptomyces spectabilis]
MSNPGGKWQRQGVIPVSRRSSECRVEPIYESLLHKWSAQGKTVPGRPDQEWQKLVGRDFWPRS